MSIEITLRCDGHKCSRSTYIDDYTDREVRQAGFYDDPVTEGQHYCSKCWPKVQKELTE